MIRISFSVSMSTANSHAAENVGEGLEARLLSPMDEPVCASDDRSAVAVGGERGERAGKRSKGSASRRIRTRAVRYGGR